MTRPGQEPTTYHVRGGHANHLANPPQFSILSILRTDGNGMIVYAFRDGDKWKVHEQSICLKFCLAKNL